MAAITPDSLTFQGSGNKPYGGTIAVTQTYLANGTRYEMDDAVLVIHQFTAAEADTWAHSYGDALLAVAWQPNDPDETNPVSAHQTARNTITWDGPSGSGSVGWLWVLLDKNKA